VYKRQILSRLNVYDIPAPDAEGTRRIASRLYASIRASHDWGAVFPEEPAEEVLDALQQCKPRELRRLLLGAFGAAKLDGRTALTARDIDADRVHRRTRIGFTH